MATSATVDETEDIILCAFGMDYFNGARYGAGIGSFVSLFCSFRLWRLVRHSIHIVDINDLQSNGPRAQLTEKAKAQLLKTITMRQVIRRGFSSKPFHTAGMIAAALTGSMKMVKFFLASQRVNEFLLDDLEFDELKSWASQDANAAKVFEEFCRESMQQATSDAATAKYAHEQGALSRAASRGSIAAQLAQTKAIAGNGDNSLGLLPVIRRPTTWDGVAVGLFGSIMDCCLPAKPVSAYYDMRFGVL